MARSSYLDIIPYELISTMLLDHFSPSDIDETLPILTNISTFFPLLSPSGSKKLWSALYRRDISSINPIPPKMYIDIYRHCVFNPCDYFTKLRFFAVQGYDILLYSILPGAIRIPRDTDEEFVKHYNTILTFGYILDALAEGGHTSMIDYITKYHLFEIRDYNNALNYAAKYGQEAVVEKLLELGANGYDSAIHRAAYKGHITIIKRLIRAGAKDYNLVMKKAALNGHMEVVKMMLKLGADDYDGTIVYANEGGHTDIVELIQEYRESIALELRENKIAEL